MIKIEKAEKVNIDTAEVLRYLGYGKNVADEGVLNLIEKCIKEMLACASFKACFDEHNLAFEEESIIFGNIKTNSKSLKKNLKDCDRVIVFVATIGIEADRIIKKYSMTSPSSAVVAQAVGTVMIEEWCDILADRLREDVSFLRPRFSPGYGDFPLEFQKNIFEILDCSRKIGVSLTDSLMMIPSKSVSGIIGVSNVDLKCNKDGCETCDMTECVYRRF